MRKLRLSTTPTPEALADLQLGDIVYLDGAIYTAREGVYKRALADKANIPIELPAQSATNFHCSPAAAIREDGSFHMGAVTATASFRFAEWLDEWMEKTGAKIIIGKGGMSRKHYKNIFVPHGAIYLSTVGYGTGALLGRGVKQVLDIHWQKELGLAQAMWVLQARNMGPFIVASDLAGNCLFERENARISASVARAYEGTRPAVLKRFGETDNRDDELFG